MDQSNTKEISRPPVLEEEKQLWLWDEDKEPPKIKKQQPKNLRLENQSDMDWIFGKQKPKI